LGIRGYGMGTGICLCVLPRLLLAEKNDPSKGRRGSLKRKSRRTRANERPCTSLPCADPILRLGVAGLGIKRSTLQARMQKLGIVRGVEGVFAQMESGKKVQGGALVYAVGRQANGDQLHLEAAGLAADSRGRLKVNQSLQTDVPHIYAAGDVIGFPALASTSMEQGRLAACHMFGIPFEHLLDLFPYGIYTIPEISMVGQTEETLTSNKVPYEVGIAKYSELAKSMMLGDEAGMLKLLFHPETHKLLGVHALGQRATEIIHIGQAVLFYGGTVEYFRDMVFNYPTLAEAYKVAALDGLNKL
jgi:NAD(P) transhydrogenase